MYYHAQKFKFWEQYRHPSVAIVHTLLFDLAHSAMSLWKCWLWWVFLTKAMLSKTFVEGEETIEIQMNHIHWSLDVCSLLLCGKILNLDEFCHTSWCLWQWKTVVLITMSLFRQPFGLGISALSIAKLTMLLEITPKWLWGRIGGSSWRH